MKYCIRNITFIIEYNKIKYLIRSLLHIYCILILTVVVQDLALAMSNVFYSKNTSIVCQISLFIEYDSK